MPASRTTTEPVPDKNVEAILQLARQDNFGNLVVNPLRTLQESQGYQQANPERREFYRNGSRLFLMYDDTFIAGDPTTYVEDTSYGTLLKPGDGDVLRGQSTVRVAYAVGYDVLPTFAFEVDGLKQGDAAALGYGTPDLANYDVDAKTWSGSTADGWFLLIAQEGGATPATYLVQLSAGTIQDRAEVDLVRGPETWGRYEMWLNWYAAGGCLLFETFTSATDAPFPDRTYPQRTVLASGVANDDGKGPSVGAARLVAEISQAAGNTGATLEWGSFSVLVPGDYRPRFKPKGFEVEATASNATPGTFEVVGGMRLADALAPGQMGAMDLVSAPSTTSEAKLVGMVVDPSETSLTDGDFSTPPELNPLDSEVQTAEDATATGPDQGGATTGINGPELANEVTNPGGRQLAFTQRGSTDNSGGPGSDPASVDIQTDRVLPADKYCLFFLDANEAGTYKYAIDFAENF